MKRAPDEPGPRPHGLGRLIRDRRVEVQEADEACRHRGPRGFACPHGGPDKAGPRRQPGHPRQHRHHDLESWSANMAFSTPSVRAATLAEIAPGRRLPRRKQACGLDRGRHHRGRHARRRRASATAPPPATRPTAPARAGRAASPASPAPVASRPATVPSGRPSCRAASLRVLPSRSHRTMTARYLSGRRLNSWSSRGCRSCQTVLFRHGRFGHVRHLPLPRPAAWRPSPSPSSAVWWATPYSQLATISRGRDRRRLADEDEEGGLEGVLGVVVVAKDAAAHAPDHRAVPPHEGRKSRLVTAAEVVLQQLPDRSAPPRPAEAPPCEGAG